MVGYSGTYTVSWAGGGTLRFANGVAPAATSANGKIDIYTFSSFDTTNTFGSDGGRNY
jgi:hypothetical protein